jgi:hypothetical protein
VEGLGKSSGGSGVIVHDFDESLKTSHEYADAPWWLDVYRKAFSGVRAIVNVREDGWAQRGGIDRVVTLKCGRTISIDEKVRTQDWPDIALEQWSDEERRKPGWVQKPLACEFIAYAFVPSQRCYLLPVLTLQRAWRVNGRDWLQQFGIIRAQNNGYVTTSVPVPIPDLFRAVNDAMLIQWGNSETVPDKLVATKQLEMPWGNQHAN